VGTSVGDGDWTLDRCPPRFPRPRLRLSGQRGGAITDSESLGISTPTEAVNQVAFGQSFTDEDGIVITVAAPTLYQSNSSAAVGAGSARHFDTAKGVGFAGQTLPPGKRQTFTAAFGLPSRSTEFRIQVDPSYGHEPVFFVGQA
jgi:hypothetical protein